MRSQFAWFAPPMTIQPSRAAEGLVRRGQNVRGAERSRRLARREIARRVPVSLLQRRLHKRGVDDLPTSGTQPVRPCGEDPHGGENAGIDVGDGIAGLRPAARPGSPVIAISPAKRLRDQIEAAFVGPRPISTVARDRAIDQRRILGGEHVVAESKLFHRAASVVLDQYVRLSHEPQQDRAPLGTLEIERESALVAVQHQERRRHAVDTRFAIAARVVAAGQLLDLDHVGTEVREQRAAGRARHDLRELEHAHARERPRMRRAGRRAGVGAHRPRNSGLVFARNAA